MTPESESRKDPAEYAREEELKGIPLTSHDQTWILARLGLARSLTDQRDILHEDTTLYNDVGMREIKHATWLMLSANYKVDGKKAIEIIEGFNRTELVNAVLDSLLVHRHTPEERTYTAWARSALLANNINPGSIDIEDMPHVLHQLVETKRAIPLEEFTAACAHNKLKAELIREV